MTGEQIHTQAPVTSDDRNS